MTENKKWTVGRLENVAWDAWDWVWPVAVVDEDEETWTEHFSKARTWDSKEEAEAWAAANGWDDGEAEPWEED